MAISAKAISVYILKFIRLSMKFMCRYAKKYPLPSATLSIIFILHLFFPFAFIFLVFSVPFFLIGYIIYRRFVPSSSKPKPKTIKPSSSIKLDSYQDSEVKNRDINSQIITKRRNAKSNTDDTNRQEDVKRVKFCISPDEDDYNAIERKEKVKERDILKDEADEITEEIEEDEDDAQEDGFGDKIVEWTEDDQKNLMEVGFSELEKNLTLENLIAKRNAGKFSMSPRSPDTIIVPHVSVTRRNPFDEIPGTAPSFFSRNPFDLASHGPGDNVHNVKFDSFEQDLAGTDRNKDKLCRHHSFTRGTTSFSAENLRNQESRMLGIFSCMERMLAAESPDKGDHDRFIEHLLYLEDASEAGSSPSSAKLGEQVIHETTNPPSEIGSIQTEDAKDPSSHEEGSGGTLVPPSKSEEVNEISNVKENNEILSSTNREILNASVNGTLEKDNQTLLNDYVNRNLAQHHSLRSVASDLQVEVSEPASPRHASSVGDFQSLVSEGEIDGIKLESQGKIRSSTKPKEAAVHSVDSSDSTASPTDLVHSGKPQEPSISPSSYIKGSTAESSENDTEEINNHKPSAENENKVKSGSVENIREESGASEVRTT